jgi:signal transduction histidine kinase
MNKVVSPFTAFLQDAAPASNSRVFNTAAKPVSLDDLIHELRQPLGVIDSLAYFIELTTTDDNIVPRLEHIKSMLVKVNHMLEDATERGVAEWPAALRERV